MYSMYRILNSSVSSSRSPSTHEDNSKLQVRIHGVDGSLATFTQEDPAVAEHIVRDCQRPDFFKQERIAVAGQHSVTPLVLSKVARIDLAGGRGERARRLLNGINCTAAV